MLSLTSLSSPLKGTSPGSQAETAVVERGDPLSVSPAQSTASSLGWMVKNRGGLACIVGMVLVPSQFAGPKGSAAMDHIDSVAARNPNMRIHKVTLRVEPSSPLLKGVIYYPREWDLMDLSSAVLYHNPNGVTVSEFFQEKDLRSNPAILARALKCPVILYDYRGVGLSSQSLSVDFLGFRPTYETVMMDGVAALTHALQRFQKIQVVGSSLGGGVATVSLERYLKEHPEDVKRVSLINHDSFSTTSRVVFPWLPRCADWMGWAVGGLLDPETAIKSLAERNIPIVVICQDNDPIIPRGARMAEIVEAAPPRDNVRVLRSQGKNHANFPWEIEEQLRSQAASQR